MIYLIICRTFAPENKRRCYVEFSEKLDIARCDACRCVRVFYLCQLRFSGADETVHEFFCGLSDSRFDLCSTIADFLQSATARVNAFSLAWMAVVVPACFGFACSCLVDIRTHGWCLQGGFRGCDGLPDLPDGYGSSCHHRQVRGECIQPDDLHVAVERSGGDSCPVDVSVGRTSCRYNLCDRFSEDIEQGVPFVALPVFPGDVVPLFPSGTASFPVGFPRPCFLSLGCRACHRDGPDREVSCRK